MTPCARRGRRRRSGRLSICRTRPTWNLAYGPKPQSAGDDLFRSASATRQQFALAGALARLWIDSTVVAGIGRRPAPSARQSDARNLDERAGHPLRQGLVMSRRAMTKASAGFSCPPAASPTVRLVERHPPGADRSRCFIRRRRAEAAARRRPTVAAHPSSPRRRLGAARCHPGSVLSTPR